MSGINKELRKKHIAYSKEILKVLNKETGLRLKRGVCFMVGDNPFIEFRVKDWENEEIKNDLLKKICLKLDINLLDWNNIKYGNISNKSITLHLREWVLVMEVLR